MSCSDDKPKPIEIPRQRKRKADVLAPILPIPDEVWHLGSSLTLRRITSECTPQCDYYDVIPKTINDLIILGQFYLHPHFRARRASNIDFKLFYRLATPLRSLEELIGLHDIKEQIFYQIMFYVQHLDTHNEDFMHTCIEGPPGCGKTRLIKILAEIYAVLEMLVPAAATAATVATAATAATAAAAATAATVTSVKNREVARQKVMFAARSDLIGRYLGETAIKTRAVLERARGGILVIDETYSLGSAEGRDSFSKECIDTLNQFLSEERRSIICIIAGYKDSLQSCFFNMNPGLERRFPHRFKIPDPTPSDLGAIFESIVKQHRWSVAETIGTPFFEKNKVYWKFGGGDMEQLFHKVKLAHGHRVFSQRLVEKKRITMVDVEAGMVLFLKLDHVLDRAKTEDMSHLMMYV